MTIIQLIKKVEDANFISSIAGGNEAHYGIYVDIDSISLHKVGNSYDCFFDNIADFWEAVREDWTNEIEEIFRVTKVHPKLTYNIGTEEYYETKGVYDIYKGGIYIRIVIAKK